MSAVISSYGDVDDLDVLDGAVVTRVRADGRDVHHHLHALDNAPEDRVLVVQPRLRWRNVSICRYSSAHLHIYPI